MKAADKQPERFDISLEELTALVDSAAEKPLDEAGVRKLKAAVQTLGYLTELVSDKATTLKRLRELLGIEFGNTEKTKAVLAAVAAAVDSANPAADAQPDSGGPTPPITATKRSGPATDGALPATTKAPSGCPWSTANCITAMGVRNVRRAKCTRRKTSRRNWCG